MLILKKMKIFFYAKDLISAPLNLGYQVSSDKMSASQMSASQMSASQISSGFGDYKRFRFLPDGRPVYNVPGDKSYRGVFLDGLPLEEVIDCQARPVFPSSLSPLFRFNENRANRSRCENIVRTTLTDEPHCDLCNMVLRSDEDSCRFFDSIRFFTQNNGIKVASCELCYESYRQNEVDDETHEYDWMLDDATGYYIDSLKAGTHVLDPFGILP